MIAMLDHRLPGNLRLLTAKLCKVRRSERPPQKAAPSAQPFGATRGQPADQAPSGNDQLVNSSVIAAREIDQPFGRRVVSEQHAVTPATTVGARQLKRSSRWVAWRTAL